MEFSCCETAELDSIAAKMISHYAGARVFAFYGKMGAGKTTFIKSICRQLQVSDEVVSPSFGIINQYLTVDGDSVFHFDFYRIKSISEFLDLGCEEYFYSGNWCFIEWPEKIEDFLPAGYINVSIEEVDKRRIIKF